MSATVKKSLYISPDENDAALAMADREGCSFNYLARMGLRVMLGKPVPRWLVGTLEEAVKEARRAQAG